MMRLLSFVCFLFFLTPVAHADSVLVYGDSIVAGYGVAIEEALPAQLEAFFREKGHSISVRNGGVSGDTTSGARTRLDWTLKKATPTLVVLAIGGNDALRGLTPGMTRENIDAMLATLSKAKIPVVLSAVNAPGNLGKEYQQAFDGIYPELARRYKTLLYPFLLADVFGKQEFMQADGIHPNAKGATLIARNLGNYLLQKTTLR